MTESEKELVSKYMNLLYSRGLVTATGGNVSVRSQGGFYITPTSVFKGTIKAEDVCLVNDRGDTLEGIIPPSSEWRMHAKIYDAFPDVTAVVHAHPTYVLALLRAGVEFSPITEEAEILLKGGVGVVDKVKPGTWELGEAVAKTLEGKKAAVIKDHGAVTVGQDLTEAFSRMDVLEQNSKIIYLSSLLLRR